MGAELSAAILFTRPKCQRKKIALALSAKERAGFWWCPTMRLSCGNQRLAGTLTRQISPERRSEDMSAANDRNDVATWAASNGSPPASRPENHSKATASAEFSGRRRGYVCKNCGQSFGWFRHYASHIQKCAGERSPLGRSGPENKGVEQ